jgi:uncharacterized protein YeaO (DUF488 family)
MGIRVKRAYEPPSGDDGMRILVDRLWPRGLSREKAKVDLWLKDVAPTEQLRNWFGHDPAKWEEFRIRYRVELAEKLEQIRFLRELMQKGTVTLVYSAKDTEHNDAVVLREYLEVP